jgi:hypothetical protein
VPIDQYRLGKESQETNARLLTLKQTVCKATSAYQTGHFTLSSEREGKEMQKEHGSGEQNNVTL